MRPSLRISKTRLTTNLLEEPKWYWFLEDMDTGTPDQVSAPFDTKEAAEASAKSTHPTVTRFFKHYVRGWGIAYEDALPQRR